ncbi:hypothetical protein GCM10010315_07610 [Streptomyces luteosporeus]|uniref:Uncharacterized protein n=1 Tax=Streptomyces luteosporeus TaxID=173856 RepID=A0ABP6G1I8_9ACTN
MPGRARPASTTPESTLTPRNFAACRVLEGPSPERFIAMCEAYVLIPRTGAGVFAYAVSRQSLQALSHLTFTLTLVSDERCPYCRL